MTMIGVLAGAVLGGFALDTKGPAVAVATIKIEQPISPNQIMTGSLQSPDTQQSYLSGEIAYLKSPGFAEAVAKELQQTTRPTLSAVQDVQSALVTVSASAPNAQEAQKAVDAALKAYHDHLQQQAKEQGQAAIDAINAVIDQVNGSAAAAQAAAAAAAAAAAGDPAAAAAAAAADAAAAAAAAQAQQNTARIQQLDDQRLAIQVQTQRAAGPEIIAPTRPTEVSGAPGWALGAVGGGLLGGIGALAAAMGWRRWVGAINSPAALGDDVDHPLQPVVHLGSRGDTKPDAGLARSLFAQLPTPRNGDLLVVGASANSGSAEVARLIAFAAAEHQRVYVERLVDRAPILDATSRHRSFDSADYPGEMTVIDGGSLETCPGLAEAAATARQIIVVVMLGLDLADSVRIVAQFARSAGVPISTVLTRRKFWSRRPARRAGHTPSKPTQPATSTGEPSNVQSEVA
ncbi:MAG: hypothetical protein U0R66_16480 [Mycobacterium sp.]